MLLKQRLIFSVVEKIQTVDRLATIQAKQIVQPMVGFSRKRKDSNYGSIG